MKIIKQHAAKHYFIEKLQCKVNKELLGQRNPASSAIYKKESFVIRATSHRHCRLLKTQQHLPSKFPGVLCFSNNEIVIEPHVIGAGQFREVYFGKFPRLSACIAAKSSRKGTIITESIVFVEAVTMLTLSGSENFPFCYVIYNRSIIIMECIGGTEITESAPTLSTAKRNGFTVSRIKFIFQKVFEFAIYILGQKHFTQ